MWVFAWISERALFIQESYGSAIDLMLSMSGSSSAGYLALIPPSNEFNSANEDSSELSSAKESSIFYYSITAFSSFFYSYIDCITCLPS